MIITFLGTLRRSLTNQSAVRLSLYEVGACVCWSLKPIQYMLVCECVVHTSWCLQLCMQKKLHNHSEWDQRTPQDYTCACVNLTLWLILINSFIWFTEPQGLLHVYRMEDEAWFLCATLKSTGFAWNRGLILWKCFIYTNVFCTCSQGLYPVFSANASLAEPIVDILVGHVCTVKYLCYKLW